VSKISNVPLLLENQLNNFLGRPGSNRSSVADVNSIPPMEAMVPIGAYSDTNIAEQNYDLPPPPDMLNDANSQSTASIDVSFFLVFLKNFFV